MTETGVASRLDDTLRGLESVAVAFSGGVDSSLLLARAVQVLGRDKVLAVTATSPTYPAQELEGARKMAEHLGARHVTVESNELEIEGFSDNPPDRCYHCKTELFTKLRETARVEGLRNVAEGSTKSDEGDYRPGLRAICELAVRSPLKEAGLTKDDVRALSKGMGLPTWNKPAKACLASRFPYGERIDEEKLQAVDRAETGLAALGFAQLRVRHHGTIGRVEIPAREIARLADSGLREKVVAAVKAAGFQYVALDLEGYRTGSMNETLRVEERTAGA